jgi:hypothetical protein
MVLSMTLNCLPEEALIMKTLSNDEVAKSLTGRQLGYADGQIICDGCGARLNAYQHLQDEGEPLELTMFAATPRHRYENWHVSLVFCTNCDKAEIGTPTPGIDEAMAECKVVRGTHTPESREVQIVDRSKPDDAVTG